jgi:hypothetical protein
MSYDLKGVTKMIKWNQDETFLGNVFDLSNDLHPVIQTSYKIAVMMFICFSIIGIVGILGQLG